MECEWERVSHDDGGHLLNRRSCVRFLMVGLLGAGAMMCDAWALAARKHRRPKRPIRGLQQHKDNPTRPRVRVPSRKL